MRKEKLEEFGRRITDELRVQNKSLHDFAKGIEKSYEMARRYARGWAIPDDPKVLDRIAAYLGKSVGYLVSGEEDTRALPPLVEASDLNEPIRAKVRMLVPDEAMLTTVDSIRLFGLNDQVILYPQKPLPGDIAAIRTKDRVTLRLVSETEDGLVFTPRKDGYATLRDAKVIGVVAGVYGKVARFE